MRKLMWVIAFAVVAWPAAARAQERNEVQGFGGLTFGSSNLGTAASSTFGGRVAVGLSDNMQIIGEAGRLADIKAPLFDLLEFTNVGVRVSAFYGEGGVRFIASPHAAVRPYGEATAGFARLSAGVSGINGTPGALVTEVLEYVNTTQPVLGVGGGILFEGGPVSVDLGYRYKKISAGNVVTSLLNAGDAYHVNQVRLGVGFRF
jgi:hypothetical protein